VYIILVEQEISANMYTNVYIIDEAYSVPKCLSMSISKMEEILRNKAFIIVFVLVCLRVTKWH